MIIKALSNKIPKVCALYQTLRAKIKPLHFQTFKHSIRLWEQKSNPSLHFQTFERSIIVVTLRSKLTGNSNDSKTIENEFLKAYSHLPQENRSTWINFILKDQSNFQFINPSTNETYNALTVDVFQMLIVMKIYNAFYGYYI